MESRVGMLRSWFEHECVSNHEMLKWLNSVPDESRQDPRFIRAVVLAGHLAACRENWLDRMQTAGASQVDWWPEDQSLVDLPSRFERVKEAWSSYFDGLSEEALDQDFEFYGATKGFRWNVEGQLMQLVGHSFYHRGQIALLVEQLGGSSDDTDYLYWRVQQAPERWHELPLPTG